MKLGEWGENKAKAYMTKQGYKILDCNYRCKMGEIDIIACKEEMITFVEVKTRRNLNYGLPCEAVNRTKIKHIKEVLYDYLIKEGIFYKEVSIDVIEILVLNKKVYLKHTKGIY